MKTLTGQYSLTKNWPGGRRSARVLKTLAPDQSVMVWNHEPTNFKKPYINEVKSEVCNDRVIEPAGTNVVLSTDLPESQIILKG